MHILRGGYAHRKNAHVKIAQNNERKFLFILTNSDIFVRNFEHFITEQLMLTKI